MSAKIDFTKYSSIEIYQMRLDGIIGRTPMRFWDISTAIEVSKYLFEEILKWNIEDIKSSLSGELLNKYKLGGFNEFIIQWLTIFINKHSISKYDKTLGDAGCSKWLLEFRNC